MPYLTSATFVKFVRALLFLAGMSALNQASAREMRRSKLDSFSGDRIEPRIPRFLHRIYPDGYATFLDEASTPIGRTQEFRRMREYYQTCTTLHKHWDHLFWDFSMGRQLVEDQYPEYLQMWDKYDSQDKRSDLLRAFILHHYGGLFLDLDVECYNASDAGLGKFDLIIQGAGTDGFTNSAIASIPGHPFWPLFFKFVQTRSNPDPDDDFQNRSDIMTGDNALSDALSSMIPNLDASAYQSGTFKVNDTVVRVKGLGKFFNPCYPQDSSCIQSLENPQSRTAWDTKDLYGRHFSMDVLEKERLDSPEDVYIPTE